MVIGKKYDYTLDPRCVVFSLDDRWFGITGGTLPSESTDGDIELKSVSTAEFHARGGSALEFYALESSPPGSVRRCR